MSNIPLKGGDGNEEAERTERADGGNQAKMSDCWKNLTTPKKAGVVAIPVIAVAAIITIIALLTAGGNKEGRLQRPKIWLVRGLVPAVA